MTRYILIESHCDGAATLGKYETLPEASHEAEKIADRYRREGYGPCRLTIFGPPIDRVFREILIEAQSGAS